MSSVSALSVQPAKQREQSTKTPKVYPLKALQSWKVTAGFAIVLIVVVIVLKTNREKDAKPTTQNLSPNASEMVKEIESLQKVVDANPKDEQATLRLANLLHDVKALPRAAMMYERYLEMNPSNPDARVDLGISYFELSLSDSTKREEYTESAKREIEKAITYAPKHQLAYFNLGIVCLHSGDMENALSWFKKCVGIDPNSETGRRAQQFLNQHSLTNPSQ